MQTLLKIFGRYFAVTAALAFAGENAALAQQITVAGGNQTMIISTAVAGSEPTSVVNTACTLTYQKQSVLAKVTISTSCPAQKFGLAVLATSVTKGTAAPAVTLQNGNPAMDLITGIARTGAKSGSCILQFTASSTFAQGNSVDLGDDVHTITYTIQAQ